MLIAIGDIHGHYNELMNLFDALKQRFSDLTEHQFIFLGDYVDGGPDTKACIEFIMDLEQTHNVVSLLGNHEQMLLDSLDNPGNFMLWYNWFSQGGEATVRSYVPDYLDDYSKAIFPRDARAVDNSHVQWMRQLPHMYESKNYYFVHAGFEPGMTPEETPVASALWIRGEFINSGYDWGKRVVFGHTYHPEPVIHTNKIGIDTMWHDHGVITALVLDDDTGPGIPVLLEFIQGVQDE